MARLEFAFPFEFPFKKYSHSHSYKNNKISQSGAHSLWLDCMAESGSPGLLSSPAPALLMGTYQNEPDDSLAFLDRLGLWNYS